MRARTLAKVKSAARRVLPSPLYRLYRRGRVAHYRRAYRPRTVSHLYAGVALRVRLEDPLAEGWYDRDWPEVPELDALREGRLMPGARVFDLGAHQGVVAMMLAEVVGPNGAVLAVEASPHNADVARKNRELNRLSHISVVTAAVSDATGELRFQPELNGRIAAGRSGTIQIPAVTIDALAAAHGDPDVILIDVEGAEHLALAGAEHQLYRRHADWLVEVHQGAGLEELGGTAHEVRQAFQRLDYLLLTAEEVDGGPGRFQRLEERASLPTGRFWLLARSARESIA